MEYPGAWRDLEREGRRLFGGSCGAYQQPATRISQALFKLPPEKCLCRRSEDEYSWSAPGADPPERPALLDREH